MGYKIVLMKKGRYRGDESLTFSRTQLYLVVGSILAIAVLAFSLGHLVSRENAPTPEEAARLESSALPESEVLEEMKRLEQRLKRSEEKGSVASPKNKEKEVEQKPAARGEGDATAPEQLVTEKPPLQSDGTPIKVKTIETIERLPQTALEKAVSIKAYKPITRTGPITAVPTAPIAPPPPVEPEEPVGGDVLTVVETVNEPPIAPLAAEPKKKTPDQKLAEIKLRDRPTATGPPKFAVQVGSFPSEARAKMLARELKGKGYNSYVKKVVRTRAVWYRVRVGAFSDRWQAEKSVGELKKKEGLEGLIVAYEAPVR